MPSEKEDESEIFMKMPVKKEVVEDPKLTSIKPLILSAISIILILGALGLVLFFVFEANQDNQNYIIANYHVNSTKTYYKHKFQKVKKN